MKSETGLTNSKETEPIKEGWTNRVYRTDQGTIIKVFSQHKLESIIFATADILHGKLNIPFRENRLEKELEMKQKLSEKDYKVPKIIQKSEKAIEVEEIQGNSLKQDLEGKGLEKIMENAEIVAKFLKQLHEDNFSLGDASFENLFIKNKEVYSIDHEYATDNSDRWDKKRDIIHIYSDAYKLNREKREIFLEEFQKNYREIKTGEKITGLIFLNISKLATLF